MGDGTASQILQQLRASLGGVRYSSSAVLAGLVISWAGSLIIFVCFCIFWKPLKSVWLRKPHATERSSHDAESPSSESLWVCTQRLWKVKDVDCVQEFGVDGTIYLRGLRMFRSIFIILTIVVCGVCVPVNVVYNLRSRFSSNLTKQDALLLMTPSLLSGSQMIPHVVLAWVTNIVILFHLWVTFAKNLRLRQSVLQGAEFGRRLINRTLMAQDLSSEYRTTAGLALLMAEGCDTERPVGLTIGHSVKQLDSMLKDYSECVRKYERLVCSQKAPVSEIEECERRMNLLASEIEVERAQCVYEQSVKPYGFASYQDLISAHSVARKMSGHRTHGAVVRLAPEPKAIMWNNLELSRVQRTTKQLWVNFIFGALVLLWIVPNAFIGCFIANLSRLAIVWPAFGRAMSAHKTLFAIIQGFLAPSISEIVFSSLPVLFRRFSRWQGKVTRIDREHEVLRKLYFFYFFDNLFIFSLIGVIWDIVAQVLETVNHSQGAKPSFEEVWTQLKVPQRIATAIVNISSFWVMYLVKAVLGSLIDFIEIWSLLDSASRALKLKHVATPREKLEAKEPQPFLYASQYLSVTFYATIALGFATIQPLVLPFTALYFTISCPLKKYSLMYNRITKYESNGSFWLIVNNIMLFSLAFGNLMVLCVIAVQGGWRIAMATVPLPVIVIIFKIVSFTSFDVHFDFVENTSDPETRINPFSDGADDGMLDKISGKNSLGEAYLNPALTCALDQPMLPSENGILLSPQASDQVGRSRTSSTSYDSETVYESVSFKRGDAFLG